MAGIPYGVSGVTWRQNVEDVIHPPGVPPAPAPPAVRTNGTTSFATHPRAYGHHPDVYPPPPPVYPPPPPVYPPQPPVYPPQAPYYPPRHPVYPPPNGAAFDQFSPHPQQQFGQPQGQHRPYQQEPWMAYPGQAPTEQYPPQGYAPAYPPVYGPGPHQTFQAPHFAGYHQAASAHSYHANGQTDDATLFGQIRRNNPPYFYGDPDPTKAERWLRDVETLFTGMGIPEGKWAHFSKTLLLEGARDWLDMIQKVKGKIQEWPFFKELFLQEYFPSARQTEKMSQFLDLKQDGKSVMEYQQQFYELGRYVPEIMNSEKLKISRFIEGLDQALLLGLGGYKPDTMLALTERVSEFERIVKRKPATSGDKRPFRASDSSRGAPRQIFRRPVSAPTGFRAPVAPAVASAVVPPCPKCNKNHPGECRASTPGCFTCGKLGHYSRECPQRKNQNVATPSKPPQQSSGKDKPRGPTRVYALEAEICEEEEPVVTGDTGTEEFYEYYEE